MQSLAESAYSSYSTPLLSGDVGTEQTIEIIRELVNDALKDPRIVRTARDMVRGVAEYDEMGELAAVFNGVRARVAYRKDPVGNETLSPAADILESGAGDCDDLNGVLLPSLLGALGYPTRLVTIAASPYSEDFSHIYCKALVQGQWIPLDAARPGTSFASAPFTNGRVRVWSLTDGSFEDFSPASGLGGYGMGDAQDVQNWINFAASTAQNVVRAARGTPLPAASSGPVYGYTNYAAAQQPAGAAQDMTPLIVIGVIAVFLFMGDR